MGKKEREICTIEGKREKNEDNVDDSYCLRWTGESKADIGSKTRVELRNRVQGCIHLAPPQVTPTCAIPNVGRHAYAPTHRTLPPTRPTYSPSQNSLDVGSFLAPFSHVSPNRASTTSNSLENLSNNSSRDNIFSFSICIK